MEIWRYGDMEVTGVNWTFPSCFLLLFSSYWISARYKWRRHGFYHLPLEGDFPRAPDPPKGHPRAVQIGSGIYEAVRGRTSLDSFFFFSSCTGMQPRRSADKEGDDVMAAGLWQGNRPSAQYIVRWCECSCTPSITLPIESTSFSNPRVQPYLHSYTRPYTDVRPYTCRGCN